MIKHVVGNITKTLVSVGILSLSLVGKGLAEERKALSVDLNHTDFGISVGYGAETQKPSSVIATKDTKEEVFMVKVQVNGYAAEMGYQPKESQTQRQIVSETKSIGPVYSIHQFSGVQVY